MGFRFGSHVPRQGMRNPGSWVVDTGAATAPVLGGADEVKVCPHLHARAAIDVDALQYLALQIYEKNVQPVGRRYASDDERLPVAGLVSGDEGRVAGDGAPRPADGSKAAELRGREPQQNLPQHILGQSNEETLQSNRSMWWLLVDLVEAGGGVRAYQRKGRVGNGDGVRRWPSPAGSTRPSAWRWGDSELRAAAGLRDEG